MRIAIINHSKKAADHICNTLKKTGFYEICWTADNDLDGIKNCSYDTPDLVIINLLLPCSNISQFIKTIMTDSPCAVLVTTESIENNTSKVFEAMGAGALDVVNIDGIESDSYHEAEQTLLIKVDTINKLVFSGKKNSNGKSRRSANDKRDHILVAIGCSTGGPAALIEIVKKLPDTLPASFVIIQHLDEQFSKGFSSWLNKHTKLPVRIALEGEIPERGTILVGGSEDHLVINNEGKLHYTPDPLDYVYRPSANEFFTSIANHWKGHSIGVLLTGMGRDGAKGLLAMHNKLSHTIAESKETCAVYGMPKAAIEMNAATQVLPLYEIADALIEQVNKINKEAKNG